MFILAFSELFMLARTFDREFSCKFGDEFTDWFSKRGELVVSFTRNSFKDFKAVDDVIIPLSPGLFKRPSYSQFA